MPLLQPEIRQDAAPPPFSATFPVSNPNNPSGSMALDSFPQRRKVRVTLAGDLTATHKENGATRTTTPSGFRSGTNVDCTGRIYVTYAGNQGSYQPVCGSEGPFTKDIVVQGQGRVFRDGYGGAGGWRCGTWPYDYCWTFSGTQQVTVEVIDYPGVLNAFDGTTPKTTVPATPDGTYLTFKWTPVPNESDIPKETYNWWYVATDGLPDGATTPSPGYPEGFGRVKRSGTMYVNVKINGVQKTLSRYIHVGPATLSLEASKTTIVEGETVDFRAVLRPDTTQASQTQWTWLPDSGSSGGVCSANLTCSFAPTSSGRMRVRTTFNGRADSAERAVTVKNDSLEISCDHFQVTRGSPIRCVIKMASGKAFRIDQLKQVTPHGEFDIALFLPIEVPSGPGHILIGPAAVPTTIRASGAAYVGESETPVGPASASYQIQPRTWSLPTRPQAQYYEKSVRQVVDGARTYVLDDYYLYEENVKVILGLANGPAPQITPTHVKYLTEGPNSGFAFLASPPTLPEWRIWINPDLVTNTAWYADQNGVSNEPIPEFPTGSERWCSNGLDGTPDDVGGFAAIILRHEGWGGLEPSHYVNERKAILAEKPQDSWEALIAPPRGTFLPEQTLRTGVGSVWDMVLAASVFDDETLDKTDLDQPQWRPSLKCHFDFFRAPSDP